MSKIPKKTRTSGTNGRGWYSRKRIGASMLTAGLVLVLAIMLVPVDGSQATTTRTGGNCQGGSGTCHPQTSSQFLTVTGFPTGSYIPGNLYRITVSIADGNGGTGSNNMNFIVSTGIISNPDSNTRKISDTQAAASVTTVSSWSFDWTAPTSGAVSADAWGVYGSGNGKSDPYDHRTLSSAQIPEFTTLIVPILGVLGLLLIVRYHKRNQPKQ